MTASVVAAAPLLGWRSGRQVTDALGPDVLAEAPPIRQPWIVKSERTGPRIDSELFAAELPLLEFFDWERSQCWAVETPHGAVISQARLSGPQMEITVESNRLTAAGSPDAVDILTIVSGGFRERAFRAVGWDERAVRTFLATLADEIIETYFRHRHQLLVALCRNEAARTNQGRR